MIIMNMISPREFRGFFIKCTVYIPVKIGLVFITRNELDSCFKQTRGSNLSVTKDKQGAEVRGQNARFRSLSNRGNPAVPPTTPPPSSQKR